MARDAENHDLMPHHDFAGRQSSAGEEVMRAFGSTTAFGHLPWLQAPVLIPLEEAADARGDIQASTAGKPFFRQPTETAGATPTEISFGPFRLLPARFLLLEGDRAAPLGSRALEILTVLLERPGEIVPKKELMARVWPGVFVDPANLTVHISALRRVLRDGRDGNRFIINIPGRGYSFVATVEHRNIGVDRDALLRGASGRSSAEGTDNPGAGRKTPAPEAAIKST